MSTKQTIWYLRYLIASILLVAVGVCLVVYKAEEWVIYIFGALFGICLTNALSAIGTLLGSQSAEATNDFVRALSGGRPAQK